MLKIIILLLFISLSVSAQKKDSTVRLTDTTNFLNIRAMNNAVNTIKDKISVQQYEDYLLIFNQIISIVAKDWESKNKKK